MNRDIEEVLKKLGSEGIPPDVEKIAEETTENFSKTLTPSMQHILWANILKARITKLAAAAVILIAVLAGIYYFGGSIDGANVAFGDVLGQIYRARTVIYNETFHPGESREFTTEKMISESGLIRTVMPHGDIMIFDFNGGKTLHLVPGPKKAILTQRVGRKRGKRLFNYLDWISTAHEKSGEFIGQDKINGQTVDLFLIKKEDLIETTIWVDPRTNLPVQVKTVRIPHPDKNIIMPKMSLDIRDFGGEESLVYTIVRSTSNGIQEEMTTVMSDFVWDAELDESLFSLEPPEGYTVEQEHLDVSDRGENGLIDALTFWTEMSGGLFPSAINDLGAPNKVRLMLVEKFDKDADPKEEFDQAVKMMHKILKGLMFAQKQKVEGSWYYAGDGVRLGEANAPVCWWKPEDSDSYRVIYGDLSVADAAVEDLPK